MDRKPAVAGQFYASGESELKKQIEECFRTGTGLPAGKCKDAKKILGAVVPHAGYMYSGWVAAYAYRAIAEDRKPKTVVMIGPDHVGSGVPCAVFPEGSWETPLGSVEVDSKLAGALVKSSKLLVSESADAHSYEHSLEVQLPFMQYAFKHDFRIVPVMLSQQTLPNAMELGLVLSKILMRDDAVVLASSDFSHYVPQSTAEKLDGEAIKKIEEMKEYEFYETVVNNRMSVCGYGPIMTAMQYANCLGGKAKLLKYATSATVTGDESQVVGYASVVFQK
jgi:AmmeMemoRadiSam system protein B